MPIAFKVPQMTSAVNFEKAAELRTNENAAIAPDSLKFLGVKSRTLKSPVTGAMYIEWLGKPETTQIVNYIASEATDFVAPTQRLLGTACKRGGY